MKKRLSKKHEKHNLSFIEVTKDGVDGETRDGKLMFPRLIILRGAKVYVLGPPEVHNGIERVPVRVHSSKKFIRKTWMDTSCLHREQLRAFLEKLHIRSAM